MGWERSQRDLVEDGVIRAGSVTIDAPRDRAGTFEPKIVAKRQRRLGSIEDIVLSLSAWGMTHGDIAAHLVDTRGSEASKRKISTITDKVLDGMTNGQPRPLEARRFYRTLRIGCRSHCRIR